MVALKLGPNLDGWDDELTPTHLRSKKKDPFWLFRVYIGDDKTTQLCGDYFIKHDIRIPSKQPGFNGK